ncbi:MAG: response regulator [Gammaproteobacteria bacterium]|nr:response regulator [Gammaproteobacteria bacterium]
MAKILVVDDSRTMREMVKTILTQLGHEVVLASDGAEALEVARTMSVDLVLTDINMPNMNGISLVSKLRRIDEYQYTPILMLTTETANYKKTKSRTMGANGWIQKPFEPSSLEKAVKKMLG